MIKQTLSILLATFIAQQAIAAEKTSLKSASAKTSQKTKETINEAEILLKISETQIAKLHHFTPKKIMDGGSTYLVKGYFEIPSGFINAFAYITKDFKTIIYGQAFDTKTGEIYSQFLPEELRKASALTYGNGKHEVFIVSDPLCPYCMRLEKELPKYKDLITVHILLISLPMHKEAPDAIRYILSKNGDAQRFEALTEISNGKTPYSGAEYNVEILDKLNKKINEMERLGQEMKVSGTPSLFDIKGTPMAMNFFSMLDQEIATNQKNSPK